MPARSCKQAVLRQKRSMCCVYLIETVWFEDPAVYVPHLMANSCRFETECTLSLPKASNKQVAEIRPSTFYSSRSGVWTCQTHSRTHSKLNHQDRCSAVIISGVPRGTPSFSFRATLFCSKLRMPSRPHRDIMVLSYGTKVESTLHVI
jgi:hypothetical protein